MSAMLFGIEWDTSTSWAFAWSILPILLRGMVVTIQASLLGFFVALGLGLLLASLKGVPLKIIAWPAAFITEFLRDTPLLIQLFFLYYVLPDYGIVLPAFLTGALALGVQYSAYTAEVYRAGIQAVPRGQKEAARALNLSERLAFIHVILPQAVVRIVPAMGNYLVSIMKDVPVLSVVTVLEMLNVAKIIGDRTFNYLIPLTMVGALYLLLTLIASWGVRVLDTRLPKRGIPLK
jgi:polar amino acid transport system permease protein